jgi:cytoskeletal protein CcmA (bactofilin family)
MLTFLRRLFSVGTDAAPEENFFISSGLEFYGDLVARASSGRIEGKFDGHIIECRKLIIGPHATIKGNVFAEEIVVYGYCEGNLYAAGDMKVFDTAVILGDIHASSLIVEHNATFRGNLRKLRTEDFLEITAREKEKIIQQRKSNVYNIHSLNARLEAEQRRARKVANGMPLTPEVEERPASPLKRIQTAVPIIVPQNRITPAPVTTGSEMPRAINIPTSRVDVSTISGGSSDFMVPSMDESFLPDYVVPLPAIGHEALVEKQQEAIREQETAEAIVALPSEPSASMLLLEAEMAAQADEVKEEAIVEIEVAETFEEAVAINEEAFIAEEVAIFETPAAVEFEANTAEEFEAAFNNIENTEAFDHFMESEDAEAMIDAQFQADQAWMASTETTIEVEAEVEAAPETELETVEMMNEESSLVVEAMINLSEEIVAENIDEEEARITEDQTTVFSFPTTVSTSFDPFPVDQNDNGIRIDPSIPFIRIPDAAPREEAGADEASDDLIEVRATFMDTFTQDVSDFGTDIAPEISNEMPVEIKTIKSVAARNIIPRQLTSPEAFELREASGTMIIIREEDDDFIEDAASDEDLRQQGGPELRGSEPMDNEEPKFKISAVPTAEPGYEPGYTNQQRTTRKPVTVQPENTRRWF